MNIAPYRLVLARPGMRTLMLIGFLARIPATAAGMATTLHVITTLDLSYARAGLAGALSMIGIGVGSPIAGRVVDRLGARPVMAVTVVAQTVYWAVAPTLGYTALVACAFFAGLLTIPVFSVMRQFLAARVPDEQRRTVFALDSMAVELSYMLGPALAVAGVTTIGSIPTMYAVGAGLVTTGLLLVLLNPPVRSAQEEAEGTETVPRRQWLTGRMAVLLVVTAATTFVLAATELSVVATLRDSGATAWTGLVIGLWCGYSLVGGFIYGALRHAVSPLVLIGGLGALTMPIGLFAGAWWWLLIVFLPAGLLCAPSLASTVDTASAWVPAGARGEAMGLHATALTAGIAAGAPVAGAVIDIFGPAWGYVVAGGVGVLLVLVAVPFWPRQRRTAVTAPVLAHGRAELARQR